MHLLTQIIQVTLNAWNRQPVLVPGSQADLSEVHALEGVVLQRQIDGTLLARRLVHQRRVPHEPTALATPQATHIDDLYRTRKRGMMSLHHIAVIVDRTS